MSVESPAEHVRTIAMVDDDTIVLEALELLLGTMAGYRVVLHATSGDLFLAQMRTVGRVDLALVDLRMPGMSGFKVLEQLRTQHPQTKAIVLSSFPNPGVVNAALAAGVCSFLPKNTSLNELRTVLDEVMRTGHYRTDVMKEGHALAEREERAKKLGVPPRELEFLGHLMDTDDPTYDRIAARMLVTRSTVDGYARWFSTHFGLHSRAALAIWAIDNGLVAARDGEAELARAMRAEQACV